MTEPLANRVPEFRPVREALTVVGVGALSFVPIAGGPAATVLAGALSSRDAKRNADILGQIAKVVDGLTEQVSGWTAEAIASDPRFLAAAERLVRAAQGSADEGHRERLIRALRHAGPWSEQEPYATERMTDLLIRLGPLHIFLTRFFADPLAWLTSNNPAAWSQGTETMLGGSLLQVFGSYVFPNNEVPPGEFARAVDELQRESIVNASRDNLLNAHLSGTGLVEPRLTEFGRSFLVFAEGELLP